VHAHVDGASTKAPGLLEPEDESVVLGNVVGRATERPGQFRDDRAVLVEQHRTGTGRPGVAARGAIRVEDQSATLLHGAKTCRSRSRSTLPPETIATTRSPGRAFTAPAISAPVAAAPAGSAIRPEPDADGTDLDDPLALREPLCTPARGC